MKNNRQYEIAWQGLKEGMHSYSFHIDDHFMVLNGSNEGLTNWDADIAMQFDKRVGFFLLHFDVAGTVSVACDRCGDDLSIKLWDEFDLVIKLTSDDNVPQNDSDDVVFIPRNETVIDISKWLYEFLMLSVPLQRVHSILPNAQPGCNPAAINLLDKLAVKPDEEVKGIWKGLESLRNKKLNSTK